jgi:predicted ATPase/DNA-binding CsgD family transcriptional regulator
MARRVTRGNVPAEVTSFVGRRRELSDVRALLAEHRLVTVTGTGGVGKTRLTLRAAAREARAFPDGVWFADLTELHNLPPARPGEYAEDVARRVAVVLGLQDRSGLSSLRQLTDYVGGRRMLLLLDNCEHLVQACAVLVAGLVRACPGVRILATSRDTLKVAGEAVFSVPPLPAPVPDRQWVRAELARCESVILFVARARAVTPGFDLTADNYAAVGALCHRLEGLPLAIELAAARVVVLAPQQILDRLADRFALLARAGRGVPARQRSLRACVDWSFHLCGKPEQLLWARLSVFVGGFELDAAEWICTDEAVPAAGLPDLVDGLVDKSILVRDGRPGQAPYRMVETIRDYGQALLLETGEQQPLRRRHRDWYRRLVTRAKQEWISPRQEYWMTRLAREHPNLRAAVDYCLAVPGEAEAALAIALTLPGLYWWTGGLLGEGRRWLDRGLAQVGAATAVRARALLLDGQITMVLGLTEAGMRLLDEGERLALELGTTYEIAFAAFVRGLSAMYRGDFPGALDRLERSRAVLSTQPLSPSGLELRLGQLNALALAAALAGDQQRADARAQELLAITERRGESRFRLYALWALVLSAWRQGDIGAATTSLTASLRLRHGQDSVDPYGMARCVEAAAWIAGHRRQYRRAATLLGAADTLWTLAATPISTQRHLNSDHDGCVRPTLAALGDRAYADAFARGQALTYDDAIAYALRHRRAAAAASADVRGRLTRRERQVADLIAQGLSNREIADTLVISQRTAESHVGHILAKLSVGSRAEAAAWVAGHAADPPQETK